MRVTAPQECSHHASAHKFETKSSISVPAVCAFPDPCCVTMSPLACSGKGGLGATTPQCDFFCQMRGGGGGG